MNLNLAYTSAPEEMDMDSRPDRGDGDFCEADNPAFRPYILGHDEMREDEEEFDITRAKYSTSLDPRGYIPVYEYTVGNQPIMWDRETGFVHFTGIWKCLGNSKADIVRVVDSNPELGVTKIRGGFLKIQGTWMPFEFARILCLRTAFRIRTKLIPLFGPDFVQQCLPPCHEDYGCLLLDPRSAPPTRATVQRRPTTAAGAAAARGPASNTSVRGLQHHQVRSSVEPYQRRCSSTTPRPRRSSRAVRSTTTMSVARLLNNDDASSVTSIGPHPTPSSSSSSHRDSRSPTPIPSPSSFMASSSSGVAVPPSKAFTSSFTTTAAAAFSGSHPHHHHHHHQHQHRLPGLRLPPIRTTFQRQPVLQPLGETAACTPPSPSDLVVQISSPLPMGEDLNDTIRTALLLQRLSADTGERPFPPVEPFCLPSRVTVNDQVYTVTWDN